MREERSSSTERDRRDQNRINPRLRTKNEKATESKLKRHARVKMEREWKEDKTRGQQKYDTSEMNSRRREQEHETTNRSCRNLPTRQEIKSNRIEIEATSSSKKGTCNSKNQTKQKKQTPTTLLLSEVASRCI